MRPSSTIHLIIACALFVLGAESCQQSPVYEQSPAERTARHRAELTERLVASPHGWELTYFPRVDSLLFRDATARWADTQVQQDKYGYGGYTFAVQFAKSGRLRLKTDQDAYSAGEVFEGEYDIRLGSALQLSFTTFTPLHSLIDSELGGVADFVYRYTDHLGRLIFATGVSGETNRPYIALTPLERAEAWETLTPKTVEHRRQFERMQHPQLTIRRGSRLFFQSDVPFSDARGDRRKVQERNRRRYHLFLALRNRHEVIFRSGYSALGSGYVGTEHGLTFRPGFSADGKAIFHDFEYVDGRFVAELVRIYDPLERRFVLASRHLHPEGEPTSYIAIIEDSPTTP